MENNTANNVQSSASGNAGSNKKRVAAELLLPLAGILFAGGILSITVALSFWVLPKGLSVEGMKGIVAWVATGTGLVACVAGGILFFMAYDRRKLGWRQEKGASEALEDEPQRSKRCYGEALVGVGFALVLAALVCSLIFMGFGWSASMPRVDSSVTSTAGGNVQGDSWNGADPALRSGVATPVSTLVASLFGNSVQDVYFTLGLFVLSTGVSLLGALFFFASSLWQKMRNPEREVFDANMFWAGLWFRLGEAVLFNLVFFLVLRTSAPNRYLALPLVSLLVGMFLKAGETLVFGIATRVFAAFQALVPGATAGKVESRVISLPLTLPDKQGEEGEKERAKKLEYAAKVVRSVPGVIRVEEDDKRSRLQVEYDVSKVTPGRIRQELELKGLVPDAPAGKAESRVVSDL